MAEILAVLVGFFVEFVLPLGIAILFWLGVAYIGIVIYGGIHERRKTN